MKIKFITAISTTLLCLVGVSFATLGPCPATAAQAQTAGFTTSLTDVSAYKYLCEASVSGIKKAPGQAMCTYSKTKQKAGSAASCDDEHLSLIKTYKSKIDNKSVPFVSIETMTTNNWRGRLESTPDSDNVKWCQMAGNQCTWSLETKSTK